MNQPEPMIEQHHQNNAARTYGISREHARRYPCPKCDAAAGQPCVKARGGHRVANHIERVLAAADEGAETRQNTGELSPTALAFVDGYLLSWKRDPAAARLTPQEREVGARALNSMVSGRIFLESCHQNGGSMDGMAARWNRPLRVMARRYVEATWSMAVNAAPLLETCCQACLQQMPDVIFDVTLRCPGCLALLQNYNKPIPNALDIEDLKANCAVLGTTWTAPTLEIEALYEKRFKLWNWSIKLATDRGNRDVQSETLRQKDEEAWKFIKSFHEKYGR